MSRLGDNQTVDTHRLILQPIPREIFESLNEDQSKNPLGPFLIPVTTIMYPLVPFCAVGSMLGHQIGVWINGKSQSRRSDCQARRAGMLIVASTAGASVAILSLPATIPIGLYLSLDSYMKTGNVSSYQYEELNEVRRLYHQLIDEHPHSD